LLVTLREMRGANLIDLLQHATWREAFVQLDHASESHDLRRDIVHQIPRVHVALLQGTGRIENAEPAEPQTARCYETIKASPSKRKQTALNLGKAQVVSDRAVAEVH
jgi:hypothetical protein